MFGKIGKYLLSTFLTSWILWGTVAAAGQLGITWLSFGSPAGMILFTLGGVAPAICEIALQKRNESKEDFKQFMKSIVSVKHSPLLYLYAVGGAIVIIYIPAILGMSPVNQPFYMGVILILPMIIGGGLEEIGWRGLLQPELEKRMSHFSATFLVGIIWALWHLPLWFIEGSHQQSMSFVWFCINAVMLSYFIGSVCYLSKSIFLPILTHASLNAFWEVVPPSQQIVFSIIMVVGVAAITLVIDYTARSSAGKEKISSL